MEYIIYVVIGAVAFWLGWHVRGILILAHLTTNPDNMINLLQQLKKIDAEDRATEKSEGVELRIERVGNVLYAYSQDDNSFIAQGNNLTAVLESAHSRFPNVKFFGEISSDSSAKELA